MNINWYPGHMKKTKELLIKNLKLVDIVYEILDARIPNSSKNPVIDSILQNKPRVIILNKRDLADEKANKFWLDYYNKNNTQVVLTNSLNNVGVNKISDITNKALHEKIKRLEQKGIKNKTVRAMIVGIPNVGKSTLINTLAKRKSAKTGNRPGVTKGNQWIKLKGNIELLDTPGILWPKFEDQDVALNLAFTGAIKDEVMDTETLCFKLIEKLTIQHPNLIEKRYNVKVENSETIEIMDQIAINRGCIFKRNEIDYDRVSNLILDEFRKGVLGRITLEYPNK